MTAALQRRFSERGSDRVDAVGAGGCRVVAVTVRADAVTGALSTVVAIALVMIDRSMSRGRFGQAGGGVDGRREEEGGEDDGRRHDQFRPCRHRPGHLALVTSVPDIRQCVTKSAPQTLLRGSPLLPVTG